jgi:5-methylcytosine-specific restriction enzyme A
VQSRRRGKASGRDFRLERSLSPRTKAPRICDRERPADSSAKARCTKQTKADRAPPTKESVGMSPYAPAHPCGFPGCPMLVCSAHRRCEKHRIQERKEINQRRGSAARRGYNTRWRAARKRFLLNYPLCAECQKTGQITAALVVDHIVPHKGDHRLFWDESGCQALCKPCHDRKTAATDGRWG